MSWVSCGPRLLRGLLPRWPSPPEQPCCRQAFAPSAVRSHVGASSAASSTTCACALAPLTRRSWAGSRPASSGRGSTCRRRLMTAAWRRRSRAASTPRASRMRRTPWTPRCCSPSTAAGGSDDPSVWARGPCVTIPSYLLSAGREGWGTGMRCPPPTHQRLAGGVAVVVVARPGRCVQPASPRAAGRRGPHKRNDDCNVRRLG